MKLRAIETIQHCQRNYKCKQCYKQIDRGSALVRAYVFMPQHKEIMTRVYHTSCVINTITMQMYLDYFGVLKGRWMI